MDGINGKVEDRDRRPSSTSNRSSTGSSADFEAQTSENRCDRGSIFALILFLISCRRQTLTSILSLNEITGDTNQMCPSPEDGRATLADRPGGEFLLLSSLPTIRYPLI